MAILTLPDEVLREIIGYLLIDEHAVVNQVSKRWSSLVSPEKPFQVRYSLVMQSYDLMIWGTRNGMSAWSYLMATLKRMGRLNLAMDGKDGCAFPMTETKIICDRVIKASRESGSFSTTRALA